MKYGIVELHDDYDFDTPISYKELVRCKECDMSEVYQSDSNGVMARYCKAFTPTRMVADDDYCSYGERKE